MFASQVTTARNILFRCVNMFIRYRNCFTFSCNNCLVSSASFVRLVNNCALSSSSTINEAGSNKKLYQWKQPQSHDTGIRLINAYRCLGKGNKHLKVPLVVENPQRVTWYACGPTVYDKPHLGHASSYIRFDAIRRILCHHFGLNVFIVMGITDIDDKIIHRAQLLGKEFLSMAREYEEKFISAMNHLNVMPPSMYVRVSDVVPQIISFIYRLLQNGMAYQGESGSVWFDVDGFTDSGRLMYMLDEWDDSETNHILSEKRNSKDFALWKAAKAGEPYWDAPWGKGRPGWHVECSTISSFVFGRKLDIHTGAKDLCLHHECEILQSEAFHSSEQWVNYFLHTGHLNLEGSSSKMSKSLGNAVNIDDFLKEYSSDCLRMFCLSSPWNSNLVYSNESIRASQNQVRKIQCCLEKCQQYIIGSLNGEVNNVLVSKLLEESKKKVQKSLCDNFDTASIVSNLQMTCASLNSVFKSMDESEEWLSDPCVRESGLIMDILQHLTSVFHLLGFVSLTSHSTSTNFHSVQTYVHNDLINELQNFRNTVRKIASDMKNEYKKDCHANDLFHACDESRRNMSSKGIVVRDKKIG